MTTYLEKACLSGSFLVSFVNCCQFMYTLLYFAFFMDSDRTSS